MLAEIGGADCIFISFETAFVETDSAIHMIRVYCLSTVIDYLSEILPYVAPGILLAFHCGRGVQSLILLMSSTCRAPATHLQLTDLELCSKYSRYNRTTCSSFMILLKWRHVNETSAVARRS